MGCRPVSPVPSRLLTKPHSPRPSAGHLQELPDRRGEGVAQTKLSKAMQSISALTCLRCHLKSCEGGLPKPGSLAAGCMVTGHTVADHGPSHLFSHTSIGTYRDLGRETSKVVGHLLPRLGQELGSLTGRVGRGIDTRLQVLCLPLLL